MSTVLSEGFSQFQATDAFNANEVSNNIELIDTTMRSLVNLYQDIITPPPPPPPLENELSKWDLTELCETFKDFDFYADHPDTEKQDLVVQLLGQTRNDIFQYRDSYSVRTVPARLVDMTHYVTASGHTCLVFVPTDLNAGIRLSGNDFSGFNHSGSDLLAFPTATDFYNKIVTGFYENSVRSELKTKFLDGTFDNTVYLRSPFYDDKTGKVHTPFPIGLRNGTWLATSGHPGMYGPKYPEADNLIVDPRHYDRKSDSLYHNWLVIPSASNLYFPITEWSDQGANIPELTNNKNVVLRYFDGTMVDGGDQTINGNAFKKHAPDATWHYISSSLYTNSSEVELALERTGDPLTREAEYTYHFVYSSKGDSYIVPFYTMNHKLYKVGGIQKADETYIGWGWDYYNYFDWDQKEQLWYPDRIAADGWKAHAYSRPNDKNTKEYTGVTDQWYFINQNNGNSLINSKDAGLTTTTDVRNGYSGPVLYSIGSQMDPNQLYIELSSWNNVTVNWRCAAVIGCKE